jgi:DNA-binding MarR family transcriptional regulator
MVENGYLVQQRSLHDRRSVHVKLTHKGNKLRDALTAMYGRHSEMLAGSMVGAEDLQTAVVTLRRLERFWIRAGDLMQRPQFAA